MKFVLLLLLVLQPMSLSFAAETTGTAAAPTTSSLESAEQTTATLGTTITLSNGVQVIDQAVGHGPVVKKDDVIKVHYTGRLPDGKIVDSSRLQVLPMPLTVKIGDSKSISRFDAGLRGMRIGGKRTIVIPPELGYGAQGRGARIPPNATLVFEVEIVDAGKEEPPEGI